MGAGIRRGVGNGVGAAVAVAVSEGARVNSRCSGAGAAAAAVGALVGAAVTAGAGDAAAVGAAVGVSLPGAGAAAKGFVVGAACRRWRAGTVSLQSRMQPSSRSACGVPHTGPEAPACARLAAAETQAQDTALAPLTPSHLRRDNAHVARRVPPVQIQGWDLAPLVSGPPSCYPDPQAATHHSSAPLKPRHPCICKRGRAQTSLLAEVICAEVDKTRCGQIQLNSHEVHAVLATALLGTLLQFPATEGRLCQLVVVAASRCAADTRDSLNTAVGDSWQPFAAACCCAGAAGFKLNSGTLQRMTAVFAGCPAAVLRSCHCQRGCTVLWRGRNRGPGGRAFKNAARHHQDEHPPDLRRCCRHTSEYFTTAEAC